MTNAELKKRLADMIEESSRYEERLAYLSEVSAKYAVAIDERDVARTNATYWQARAEAAEQLAENHWQTIVERNKTIIARDVEIVEWQENYAELETQLAEQGWRPVTEPPEDDTIVEAIVRLWYREPHPLLDDEPIWFVDAVTEEMDIAPEYIYGWRPIDPPAPA